MTPDFSDVAWITLISPCHVRCNQEGLTDVFVVAALFPEGVKLLVGDAGELFGTENGDALRELCIKWRWPLAWATKAGGTDVLRLRVLDPVVAKAGGTNVTVSEATMKVFDHQWQVANATKKASGEAAVWAKVWEAAPSRLRLPGTMRAGLCTDSECVGADASGDCVCSSE